MCYKRVQRLHFNKIRQDSETNIILIHKRHRLSCKAPLTHTTNIAFLQSAPLTSLLDTLTDRMDVKPIFPIKLSITIDTMLNFDGDFDGNRDV